MTRVRRTDAPPDGRARPGTVLRSRKDAATRTLSEGIRDAVDPDDPIFRVFPLTRKRIRLTDASENLDRYLYGRDV